LARLVQGAFAVSQHLFAKIVQARDTLAQNKPDVALAMLRRIAAKAPNDQNVNSLMAMCLLQLGQGEQAGFYARRAAAIAPDDPIVQTNLAVVLAAINKRDQAPEILRRVLERHPGHHEARLVLVNSMLLDRRTSEAIELCRAGLAFGWHAPLAVSYAAALISLSENERAVHFLNEALLHFPNESNLASSKCMAITAVYGADPEEVAAAHRSYGALLNRTSPMFQATYAPRKDPSKPLRVALVSHDFRQHSVAYFIEPWLEHFDRDGFEVVCYSTNRVLDAVSERLKSHATLWRDASAMPELQLAAKLSEDRVDIAVDLAGHTNGNSLQAFALRMAPVQVTYLGYPGSTGLTQMDYRIVDSLTDPPGPAVDARHTEKLLRIDPCFLCYRPQPDAPPVRASDIPRSASHITFGSFNAGRKLSGPLLDLWAHILKAVPGSRLLLKASDFNDPAMATRLHARLGEHGIGEECVEILQATKEMAEHLSLYERVDIGLDPLPYNGTTTTCEALWMGVPVITLAGNRHAGRVGVSLLTNVGLPELIARNENEYLDIAVKLAADPARLEDYRASLRRRLAASPLCDGPGFSRRFEGALRAAWKQYCAM
jgi:predicted O-linked N-acetylglucosamine transferase (SPINDLY family)